MTPIGRAPVVPAGPHDRRRSLVFLATGLHRGGAEAQLVRVARHMADLGWRVHLVSLLPQGPPWDALEGAGLPVTYLDVPRGRADPLALLRLVRLLRRERPTILCTFMIHANLAGRIAGRLAGVLAVVASVRNATFGGPRADAAMRLTDRLCTATTTNSRLVADALIARRVARPTSLHVLPNGLDAGPYDRAPRDRDGLADELGVAPSKFLWLAVGRLEPQKAHDVALDAIARLGAAGHAVHLAVAGTGSLDAALRRRAAAPDLAGRVTLLGARDDVPRLLASADALLLASAWEGLPNVVMEAHAARLPVVATRVGGTPELIEDGVSGLLAPPGDPGALADAMARLMSLDDDARAALAAAGRRTVETTYALPAAMNRWARLFEAVADLVTPAVAAPQARR